MSKLPDPQPGKVRLVTVQEEDSGQRLDNFLQRQLNSVPRTRLYRALRKGEVRVNKGRSRAEYRLQPGDIVRIPPLREPAAGVPGQIPRRLVNDLSNRIVHEDEDLLVLNKPSGLAVHGGSGLSFGLIEGLRQMRPNARYLELVHRLDRDTSGLVLIAKRASVLRELHRQLREKHIDKRYLALALGKWPRSSSRVDAPLEKQVLVSGERMVRVSKAGKAAITDFTVVERFATSTLVEARPLTGRTHQIRVHALQAGHPLLGDDKYASAAGEQLAARLGLRRLFLHAAELHFSLPGSGPLVFKAVLDTELEMTLENSRNIL